MASKGTIVQLNPDGTRTEIAIEGPPTLDKLKDAIGGGYIELVPRFNSFRHGDQLVSCVAFCDEDGKYKHMPINRPATALWDEALRRTGHPGLIEPSGKIADFLVGTIAVVFGDKRFMAAL
jgi:hypothetical protein